MAESPRRRILAHVRLADICCVIGLAPNFMWCSLEGHALRFAETPRSSSSPLTLADSGSWASVCSPCSISQSPIG